ncbi:MAG: ABC transporter substrate-binding protein [Chlorobi bacterium]|nr:ABC transporter substrate-binding protein [Chlorobiota bacterium]
MKKKLTISLVLILIAISAYYYYNKDNKGDDTKKEVVIGYPHLRIALPVIVAYHNGYFEEEGLDVKLKSYITAQPMMDAIVSGKIEMGGFCALPITFGAMARTNENLFFIGGMFEDDDHIISELLVKDTTQIKSIPDLKGKKIGILPTRAYEVWIQDILLNSSINPKDVIISYVKPNMQADALNSGLVNALFTNDPAATISKKTINAVPLTNEALVPKVTKMNPFYFGSFNVRKDFADENPETVKKVTKALNKAIDFIANNQNEAKKIMAKVDPKRNVTYLPDPFTKIVEYFPNSLFMKSNEVSNDKLEQIKNYYLKKKILPKNIDVKNLQYK